MNLDKIKEEASNELEEHCISGKESGVYDTVDWLTADKILAKYIDKAVKATRDRYIEVVEKKLGDDQDGLDEEASGWNQAIISMVKALRNLD